MSRVGTPAPPAPQPWNELFEWVQTDLAEPSFMPSYPGITDQNLISYILESHLTGVNSGNTGIIRHPDVPQITDPREGAAAHKVLYYYYLSG